MKSDRVIQFVIYRRCETKVLKSDSPPPPPPSTKQDLASIERDVQIDTLEEVGQEEYFFYNK